MTEMSDVLVVGAGMAGASAAWALSALGSVRLLEQEDRPGYHTTGRSAALFTETYGNSVIRRLTSAGRAFFKDPPDGFAAHPLLSPRGTLLIARADQTAALERVLAETPAGSPAPQHLSGAEACALNPALAPDYVAAALYEPDAEDIDVDALHQGFLRGLKARGGTLSTRAEIRSLARKNGLWIAETPAGRFAAPVLVNAAGAWADAVAGLTEIAPIGLVPKRRTAFTFAPSEGVDPASWPATIDVEEQFYFKPEAGLILGSPADETPSPPCDAQPEELDVAIGVDRIETATVLQVRRIAHKWAGLRSFVADKTPVVGFDPAAAGFFWLAGQGGYGIQTAPALARTVASLIETGELPSDQRAAGITAADLSPERLTAAAP
ncbi:MAG: FAD-binding oxidoreductase [Pseudomonadota bacterium]